MRVWWFLGLLCNFPGGRQDLGVSMQGFGEVPRSISQRPQAIQSTLKPSINHSGQRLLGKNKEWFEGERWPARECIQRSAGVFSVENCSKPNILQSLCAGGVRFAKRWKKHSRTGTCKNIPRFLAATLLKSIQAPKP